MRELIYVNWIVLDELFQGIKFLRTLRTNPWARPLMVAAFSLRAQRAY